MMHGTRFEDLAPAPPALPAVPAPPVPSSPPVPTSEPASPISANWKYVNRAGSYSVDFPKQPTESTETDATGAAMHQTILTDRGICYGVVFYDLRKQDLESARTQAEGVATFQKFWKDSVVRQQGGTVVSEKSVDVAGHAGYQVEFVLQQGVHLVGRMVVVGTRCYRVAVWGIGRTTDNPAAREFLNSFRIVD